MNKELSFRDALSEGWRLTKENVWLWLGLWVTFAALTFLGSWIPSQVGAWSVSAFLSLGLLFLQWFLTFNSIGIALALVDGKEAGYADLWRLRPNFGWYILATLLVMLIVSVGFFLLVVPGIIWGLMFIFTGFVLAERQAGPLEALKASKVLTQGVKADLFLFWLILLGINLVGALFLLVGLLATTAISFFALAHLYRQRTRALEATKAL